MVIQGRQAASHTDRGPDSVARGAAIRHTLPPNRLAIALSVLTFAIGGCATYKPTVPPSQGHINAAQYPDKAAEDKILAPVITSKRNPNTQRCIGTLLSERRVDLSPM